MSTFYGAGASRLAVLLVALVFSGAAPAGVNVLTERYDNARTGADLGETILTPTTVAPGAFGKLWSYTVIGSVYAQPLYIEGLQMPGLGVHNVLFVATMNDVVYAFDADSSTLLWSVDLTSEEPGAIPLPVSSITGSSTGNIDGNVGIESTPVIDFTTNTLYLVARTLENEPFSCTQCIAAQRLHALDIMSGAEKFGGPVLIAGSVAGTGDGGSTVGFNPQTENQRSSLALTNGQVYIAWASHEDLGTWHGWIMSYNAATLAQTSIFCTTPNTTGGGVWMSGRAPAVDANGNVYYMVGNAHNSNGYDGSSDFGESMLKFSPSGIASPVDWFTPSDWVVLDDNDRDYGASGPLLIPGSSLVTGAGKDSNFYVMSTASLGHEQAGNGQIVQTLANNGGEVESGPVFWAHNGGLGPVMYDWSNGGDYLKGYSFTGSGFVTTPVSMSSFAAQGGNLGAVLTVSGNSYNSGTGIVWASMPQAGGNSDNAGSANAGVLRAFNADNLSQELWESDSVSTDAPGIWPKFSPPTVANGRVYMASIPADGVSSTTISVYGLFNGFYPTAAALSVLSATDAVVLIP
jgi:hypothetical protein